MSSTVHVVRQGECLSLIALRYGFSDWRTVYHHEDNAALRRQRPNPNVLLPGDVVLIPAKQRKEVRVQTGREHRFVLKRASRYVRLRLEDGGGQPLAHQPYTLEVEGEVREGTTDGEGLLEEPVSLQAQRVELACGAQRWELELGHLNPMQEVPVGEVSGVRARLRNLGYAVEATGPMDARLRSAVRAFQHEHGLKPTGHCDATTLGKLLERHGS